MKQGLLHNTIEKPGSFQEWFCFTRIGNSGYRKSCFISAAQAPAATAHTQAGVQLGPG